MEYERAIDEVELVLMGSDCDISDKLSVLTEVLCRLMAQQEFIPDARFFSKLQTVIPGRVATIILENNEAC